MKRALTFLVMRYQQYAPERMRAAYKFEPSCSSYMVFAIEKRGLLKRACVGIRRLVECRSPHEAEDYP